MFGNILKILFSYKIFTFSQHPNKFYYKKFQYICLTHPKIKIKTLSRGRKWDRREKEWQIEGKRDRSVAIRVLCRTMAARSGGCGGGVEWAGGWWRLDRRRWARGRTRSVCQERARSWVGRGRDRAWVVTIGLGWIGLGWRCRWASNSDYGYNLAGAGVRRDQCWDVISPVLQAARSCWCWGVTRPVWSGVGAGVGCDETSASGAISFMFHSLSSIFLGWKSF